MTEEPPIQNSPSPSPQPTEPKDSWSLKELIRFAVIAAVIVLPIRFFIAEPYLVRQTSMLPTFKNNDYLIVEKLSYKFKPPERGDVIIFHSPIQGGKTLIKRIVGLPGEIVDISGETTAIQSPDDNSETVVLSEPYVIYPSPTQKSHYTLGPDQYFVMGDNRAGSYDSRSWGPIEKSDIIGRPLLRLYHFEAIATWPGMAELPDDYPKENLTTL